VHALFVDPERRSDVTLACRGVTLAIAGRTLCRDLEFTVQPGEVWGVLGPNGSGKTTLLNALSGLAAPACGSVAIDGQPLAYMGALARARLIGVLPQHAENEFWGTALDYALLGRFPHAPAWLGWQRDDEVGAQKALARAGVADIAGRRYATLSGGERQRVRIAQLLAQAPRFMLFDEPLQHLDLRYQIQVLGVLAALARDADDRRGVVLVLHDVLWPARVCTHALLLGGADNAEGTRAGAARDVLTQGNLEALFGCALQPAGAKSGMGFVPAI
jgi:iron complex transport system ATP-binding protein